MVIYLLFFHIHVASSLYLELQIVLAWFVSSINDRVHKPFVDVSSEMEFIQFIAIVAKY